jgi:hypothetical protein
MVQEAIHSSRKNKGKGMIIKIVMANTFDRVRHSLFFYVPSKFGFNTHFIQWISTCVSGPWIAPLVNWRPTNF